MHPATSLARPVSTLLLLGAALLIGGQENGARAQHGPKAFVITGARLADGSGNALRTASVRVADDVIAEVGEVKPGPDDELVDGTGLVLSPGFIDPHNHSTDGLETDPDAVTQVSQGITTVALGQDGSSPWPIADYVARRRAQPSAINIVLLVGHATVRRQVMGDDYRRQPRAEEVRRMRALVDQAMLEGAVGLSSGLEYEVGSYSDTEEVVELARAAAARGGIYISHIRDEADRSMEAIVEAIAVGERAKLPVQITHIKLGTVGVWGKAEQVVRLVDAARARGVDVTADAYPYLAWQSNLKVLVPNKKYDDPASVQEALDDIGGGRNVQITRLPMFPQHVGKRLDEVARAEGLSEVDAYIRIVKDEDAGIIGHTMSEPDLRTFYRQPWTMVSSDGGINNNHPRGAGTFPRVLGKLVREDGWMTLPEAVRKMTSMPAARLGLNDRGLVRPGMKADLVLFDPDTVLDRSTFEEPRRLATGVRRVWVNGRTVWTGSASTGERPGRVLTRPARSLDRPGS
jgi:N-acyl-D-amino-acid deacylase